MKHDTSANLRALLQHALGPAAATDILDTLQIHPALLQSHSSLPRAVIATALNAALFADLLQRAPSAAAYVADQRRAGARIVFDHGALRTVRFAGMPTGALPAGADAFARILEPLGYVCAGVYPLERLRMTGRAYAQADLPEDIPQFFVSELHAERFSAGFQGIAQRVFGASSDPLDVAARELLSQLSRHGEAPLAMAQAGLPALLAAFARQHPLPTRAQYDTLLAESAEAAWIATEGNAFNHATDRVADVDALAAQQRRLGRPIKDAVEVSASGRVRQTAFKADSVRRHFAGEEAACELPGSFYEFISRARLPDGRLDLSFDSGNAQGIFAMTVAAKT